MSHDQPAYARVPGIRVYGMMCNTAIRNRRDLLSTDGQLPFVFFLQKCETLNTTFASSEALL